MGRFVIPNRLSSGLRRRREDNQTREMFLAILKGHAPQLAAATDPLNAAQPELHFLRQRGTDAVDDVLVEDSILFTLADVDHAPILGLPDILDVTRTGQQSFHLTEPAKHLDLIGL
jgi:hypothetical protein